MASMPRRDRGERDDARSGGNYRVELSDRFWPIAAIPPRELSIQNSHLPAGIKPLTEPCPKLVLPENFKPPQKNRRFVVS